MSFQQISAILRSWPRVEIPVGPFEDVPCERLRLVLSALQEGSSPVGAADLANLVRHVVRSEAARFDGHPRLHLPCETPWPTREEWKTFGCFVTDAPESGFCTIEAQEWLPDWLEHKSRWPPYRDAEAGEPRRRQQPVPADPAIREAFNLEQYLSEAQADALRGVVLAPSGSVTVVALPTGAGKSLVGLSVAVLGSTVGVTVVVVPTIALAYDQAFQARQMLPGNTIDAWRSELKPDERNAIRQRIRDGQQRIIYAAPESIVGALAGALYAAAQHGLLRGFVVDEAHLVAQWGNGFRPDFQAMSGLWQQLRLNCPPNRAFRTVLMTATLTEESHRTLQTFFGPADRIETLASVHLRPEPDYFIAQCRNSRSTPRQDAAANNHEPANNRLPEQEASVLEALRHGPRPAILYVTERKEADWWFRRLRQEGWSRVDCIHGGTSGGHRERAIDAWRKNKIDLMVATSAFGLGMDKSDVRLVIHACVPETVDRFYQEVGRGGRDGNASLSVLLWTQKDRKVAESLSNPTIITEELGLERWKAILHDSEWDGETLLANLHALRPGMTWESKANMGWNLKTLLLLARAGALTIESRRPPELNRDENENELEFEKRQAKEMEKYWSLCPVRVQAPKNLLSTEYWETVIARSRDESFATARANWLRMTEVLEGRCDLKCILQEVYRVPDVGIEVGEGSEGLPVRPPSRLCGELSDSLCRLVPKVGLPILIVTYRPTEDWRREVLRVVTRLVKLGIREIAAPESWRSGSESLKGLHRDAPEGFLIVREITETDPHGYDGWPLPRVSIIAPASPPVPIFDHLLLLERPFHLVFAPMDAPDARHPNRKIGDVSPPQTMRSDTLENLLQQ
ncbi:MAG: ATP-dependent DNA helicase RecQ [Verrucomicrobiales bacterium]|jgi:ATP-dependent DNA helicase RecQ